MAAQSTIESLVAYYVNLLIIQYHNQPKAQAHIALIIDMILMSAVMLDVLNGYDIDTAVGVQLDVLGKYAGVSRYYDQIDLVNYFGLTTYSDGGSPPAGEFGLCTYATFNGFSYNGTLKYNEIVTTKNALVDDDFRILIKLAILTNTCTMGWGEIDQKIFNLFGTSIRAESFGKMRMFYVFTTAITSLIQAMILNKILPKPMGVRLVYIQQNSGKMFGLVSYDGIVQPNEMGCTTYANYATTPGACLTYAQIIQG